MNDKIVKKELACKLTEEEILIYSRLLAKETEDKTEAENRKKDVASEYTATINQHTTTMGILSRKITSGQEHRVVECFYEHDWPNNEKTLFRSDTGAMVKIEEIEAYERQQHLKLREKEEAGKSDEVKASDTEPTDEQLEEVADEQQ